MAASAWVAWDIKAFLGVERFLDSSTRIGRPSPINDIKAVSSQVLDQRAWSSQPDAPFEMCGGVSATIPPMPGRGGAFSWFR